MKFELLEQLQREQQSQKEEVSRKKSVFEVEQKKLADLHDKLKDTILNGANESDLDPLYDEIAKQETITERRKSEYQLVSERTEATGFDGKSVSVAFQQFQNEYDEATIQPIYAKLAQIKKNYLEAVGELESAMRAFNAESSKVENQLARLQKLNGGPSYCASIFGIKYNELDIQVPRSTDLW